MPPLLRTQALLELLAVHVEGGAGTGYAGTLSSADAPELNTPRTVRGASCEEVLEALSWVGALGLERIANESGAAGSTDSATVPEALSLPPPAPLTAREADTAPSERPKAPSEPLRPGAMAFALFQNGVAPGSALELGAAFALAWSLPNWQPSLSLGVYAGAASETHAAGATGRLRHWSTQAVGCPWRWALSGAFGLRPCVDLDVGVSSGRGTGVVQARSHSVPSLSTAAELRAEASWGELDIGASAGAVVPLWRAHFYFSPNVSAFDPPALGLRLGTYAALFF